MNEIIQAHNAWTSELMGFTNPYYRHHGRRSSRTNSEGTGVSARVTGGILLDSQRGIRRVVGSDGTRMDEIWNNFFDMTQWEVSEALRKRWITEEGDCS